MERAVENTKHTAHRGNGPTPIVPGPSAGASQHPLLQLQQQAGNQAVQELLRSGLIRAKLAIGQPGNPEEQEADRVADQVMRIPDPIGQASPTASDTDSGHGAVHPTMWDSTPTVQRKCNCGGSCDKCQAAEADEQQSSVQPGPASLQISRVASSPSGAGINAPPSIHQTLSKLGDPLDATTRAGMEARFGSDFSAVRIHNDAEAAQSATDVGAQAYTVGQHVVFGAGRYASGTSEGQRLLAHELTHVVQQNGRRNRPMLMRQKVGGGQQQAASTTFYQQLYVVRDPSIGLGGGHLVADLAAFKAQVMRLQNTGAWTLVLAIHGSSDRIAAQAPPNWQQNAVFYTAADIDALFNGDAAWVQWRDTYGPSQLSLVSCQVSASFEGAMINNLTRHVARAGSSTAAPTQSARGMGTHCKPYSQDKSYEFPAGIPIKTRAQYARMPASAQQDMESVLSALNSQYGYYGAPPVPGGQILDYYFDVDPPGAWAIVTVAVEQGGTLTDQDIPFWNRTTGPRSAEFRQLCDQGIGTLTRPHIPTTPP